MEETPDLDEIYKMADEYICNSDDLEVINSDINWNADGFKYLCRGETSDESIKDMLEDFFKEKGYNIIATVSDYESLFLHDFYEFSVQFEFVDDEDNDE